MISWVSAKYHLMWYSLAIGFLLVLWAAFGSAPADRMYVFDIGYRLLRVGSVFSVFPELW